MPYGSKIRTSLFSFRHFIEEAPRQGPTTNDEDVSPVSPAGVPQQGSQTMDPRAPHSSLPSGTGRTDVPMAKRSRLRYLNNDDDDEQRRCPTFKSSNGQLFASSLLVASATSFCPSIFSPHPSSTSTLVASRRHWRYARIGVRRCSLRRTSFGSA